MLYLAEVIQKKGGIIGGGKSEFKLLACQRAEQNWSAVPGEDVIASEEASRFSGGTLVLVDLTANKQVQRVQEASRPLVSILQNFSRLQEKFKTQEEEIEQWKQSLTYQSQELNRREMEMEARREQLQQLEEDFEQLEQQRQQFEVTREEVTRGQADMTRNRQELEQAWEHLRGEMRRLEERQSELQQSTMLDDEQAQVIRELLDHILNAVVSAGSVQEHVQETTALIAHSQEILNVHWQAVQQQQQTSEQTRETIARQADDLQRRWREWEQTQESLERAKGEVTLQHGSLQLKQEYAQLLGLQVQNYEELHLQLHRMAAGDDSVSISAQVDLAALEQMKIEDLQPLVKELERDLKRSLQFVNGQEEELESKEKELDELRQKIRRATEFDRLSLESELTDEQDAYQFLNKTLVGQRRSLKEQDGLLQQHRVVLAKRQGKPLDVKEGRLDVGNVLAQMDDQRQQRTTELQQVEGQIAQIRGAIEQTQALVDRQVQEQAVAQAELKQAEEDLRSQQLAAAQMVGQLSLYQEFLQPIQDTTDGLKRQVESLVEVVAHIDGASATQTEAVGQMQQILHNLTNLPN